jgi:glycerol-3-phosphate acyltransferase PlsY
VGYALSVVVGYLLGSIPVAALVARRHGVDLHARGDGNPGAWNAREQLGALRAAPVFIGDGAKGLAAGLAGLSIAGWWGAWAAVAAAMIGHALPLFARFRGGKSVMCFVGGAMVLSPVAAAICWGLCIAVSLAASFAWGARIGTFAFPVVQSVADGLERAIASLWLMGIIGALFGLAWLRGRRSGRASAAPAAAPRV